jgi:hypothetical protein
MYDWIAPAMRLRADMKIEDELFEQAKRLKRAELLRLAHRLDDYACSLIIEGTAAEKGPYTRTLTLSGAGHGDSSDVSSSKGKDLAEAYAPRRGG